MVKRLVPILLALTVFSVTTAAAQPVDARAVAAGPPIGALDTPADMSLGLSGTIAVTGWALDDTGVASVVIERDAHPGDPAGAIVNGRVVVGTATFVAGARPDIASAFADYPNAARAGWGYLMLTRGLIWDGQGPFRLYAVATDTQGQTALLGTKTIAIDNSTATKPFGTIDSPASGASVSGLYPVTGWVLTPNPGATIPAGGVRVAIDNVFVPGVPSMSARSDISAGFPTFDTRTAGRGLFVDTTQILNGVHTIGWLVTDSTGQADGIGSRFFTIANPTYSSGQFLVGKQMAPGRYFTDPVQSCYWERQSGLGGTLSEIIANDFVADDAGQLIVDVKSTDVAFQTEAECGAWSLAPVRGLASSIGSGAWLVNRQVAPGTYAATAARGCYWERRRDFEGTTDGIIASDFAKAAGQELVTIAASDVGFYTSEECGTWQPVSASLPQMQLAATPSSRGSIDANWRAHRAAVEERKRR